MKTNAKTMKSGKADVSERRLNLKPANALKTIAQQGTTDPMSIWNYAPWIP